MNSAKADKGIYIKRNRMYKKQIDYVMKMRTPSRDISYLINLIIQFLLSFVSEYPIPRIAWSIITHREVQFRR